MKKIPLTQGEVALVDDEDYSNVIKYKWHLRVSHGNGKYAGRTVESKGKKTTIFMHNFIMGKKEGLQVDHINLDGLYNCRSNLRFCTTAENIRNRSKQKNNTSGYKGVTWHRGIKKWHSQIGANGKKHSLGYYFCIVKAARIYDAAARKYFGEFARCNFALEPVLD